MRKALLVALHQVRMETLRWSFLIVLFIPPILFGLGRVYARLAEWATALEPAQTSAPAADSIVEIVTPFAEPVGLVDEAGLIHRLPADVPSDKLIAFPDEAAARAAITAGTIAGYYVIPPDYVATGRVTFYSPNPTRFTATDTAIESLLALNLAGAEGEAVAARIVQPLELSETQIDLPLGPPPGSYTSGEVLLGLGIGLFFFLTLSSTGGPLLGSLVTEKRSSVLEVLLGAISTDHLLAGKLIGTVAFNLLQTGVWLAWLRLLTGTTGPLAEADPRAVAAALAVFVFGYFAFAAMMALVGALVQNYRESAQITALFSFGAMVPLFGLFAVLIAPDGAAAILLSLVPVSAPVIMPVRLFVTDVPLWQFGVCLLLLVGWTALVIRLAARLFRARLALEGRSLKWGLKVLRG